MRKTMQATAHCQQTSTMNKYAASAGHNRPVPPEASLVILFGILSSRNVFQLGVLPYSKQRIDTQAATGCDWILETVCLKRIDTLWLRLTATCQLISGKRHRIFINNTYTQVQQVRTSGINVHIGANREVCRVYIEEILVPPGFRWSRQCCLRSIISLQARLFQDSVSLTPK